MARDAVFRSWINDRAIYYRRQHRIPDDLGTAVNVQAMVFGNMGETSATGVGFTRNPATGENRFYGEYLINAQGEDVVAGIRTPHPIAELEQRDARAAYRELREITQRLEQHYRDVQDFEFTDPGGQALPAADAHRQAHRRGRGADRRRDGGRGPDHAATRRCCASSPSASTSCCTRASIRSKAPDPLAEGLAASPGAAVGARRLHRRPRGRVAERGEKVILVRQETTPDDIHGMDAAPGHPDRDRRHDVARRGGRARHGQVLRRRRLGACVVEETARRFDGRRAHDQARAT